MNSSGKMSRINALKHKRRVGLKLDLLCGVLYESKFFFHVTMEVHCTVKRFE